MKKNSLFGLIFGLGLITFAAAVSITSCEVGLGEAVDTSAPNVFFSDNTVTSSAVIRDSFIIHGFWTDDGTIKDVKATLKTTTDTGSSFINEGTVVTQEAGKGTWSVVFDPIEQKIPDGPYEISIAMTDNGKHTSTITRAVVIDNTAPLVVLSRPSTKKDSYKPDSYGQSFTLEGKAADDNDVSLIEVNVYPDENCSGTPLKTITLPNVPLTIEQDVAVYSATEPNDYSVIYGHVDEQMIAIKDGTTTNRYCTLVVYDGAQRYPADGSAQTDADRRGNSVNYYYLNADVSRLFTAGYKITDLYHILNGSYEQGNSSRSISSLEALTLLQDTSKQTTCGTFSINPENSPTYVVSSRNVLEQNHTLDEYPVTNGNNQLEIEITPGLDGHLIVENTVGIYLVRCDLEGNALKTDGSPAANENEAKKICLVEPNNHNQEFITLSGSTYKFKTEHNIGNNDYPELVIGENYYISVVGKDEQGNNIVSKGLYGFQLITSGKNIDVGIKSEPEWLSTNSDANAANKSVKITLSYSTENKPFEIRRALNPSHLNNESTKIADGIQVASYEDTTLDISQEPEEISYKIFGHDSAESNTKTISLKYDDTEPVVTITDIPDTTATQQSTITFKGTASDNNTANIEESGVKTVYVQIIDQTDSSCKTPAAGETDAIKASYSGGEWLCQIKPSDYIGANGAFKNEGPKTIKVTAIDGVGLKTEVSDSFVFDTAAPKITITSSIGDSKSVLAGGTFTINGTLVEKYGLAQTNGFTITQVYTKFDETTAHNTKTINITPPVANSNAWSITLPFNGTDGSAYDNDTIVSNHSADGNYVYTISAKDKADKSDNDGIQFTAVLKTDGPNIQITSPEFETVSGKQVTKNWQKTKDIMISGKASSPATVSKIYWTTDSTKTAGTWTGWEEAEGADNWNFTVSVATDKADHKVYIAAIDSLGNYTAKKEYTLKVDSSAPSVAPKFYQIGDSGEIQTANGTIYVSKQTGNAQSLTVYGTYSEAVSGPYVKKNDSDPLKPLAFTIDGSDKAATITYSDTNISSGIGSATFTATSPSLTTQSWKAVFANSVLNAGGFVVTARNGAGLSNDNTELTINEDSESPEFGASIIITNSSKKETKTEDGVEVDYYYVNNNNTPEISGTASDANLLSVEVKAECTGEDPISKSLKNNPFNWSFELKDDAKDMKNWTNASDGSSQTKVTLTITDKAGNKTVKKLKFIFDTTPPVPQHVWDDKGKDAVFRIGDYNNELEELKTYCDSTITELDTTKDINVGGKYTKTTFGNAETIRIRGLINDTGSGVAAIYYKLFDHAPSKAEIEAFRVDPENTKSGSTILPLTTKKTQRVSYTTDATNNTKEFRDIDTNYTTLISDLKANDANYVVIVAEDKVGNRCVDYAEEANKDAVDDVTGFYYTLNIDTISPTYKKDYAVTTKDYVNPTTASDITIAGIINSGLLDDGDSPAMAANVSVELKVNGKRILVEDSKDPDYTANSANGKIVLTKTGTKSFKESAAATASNVTCTNTNVYWSATIKPGTVFSGASTGAYAVDAIVTDGAGNKQTFTVATINIDITDPTVNINTITDADKDTSDKLDVNGELLITGTANDTEKLASVKVEYKKSSPTDAPYTEKAQETGSTPSNWKVKFDTTSLDDTTSYIIRVTATDTAGNSTFEDQTIYVNQDSDRPVVKFTNLVGENIGTVAAPVWSNFVLKYGTNARLEGTITDDDSAGGTAVKQLVISSSEIPAANISQDSTTKVWTITGATGITDFKSSGDYTFTPANTTDGSKDVYFYVVDNKDTLFYTKQSAQLSRPYLQYKDEASSKIDPTTKLTYKSDSNSPEINHAKLIAITPDTTTVYRSFEWGDVKDEQNAATLYFTDKALTPTAHPTSETSDDTMVYRSFTWSAVKTQTNAARLYFIDKGLTRNPQSEALETLDSSCNVGGETRNLVQLQVSARDGNGIKKIVITANGVDYDSTKSADGTVKTESGNTIFTTKKIDLTNVAEGSKTVTVMVYDNCDLNNKQTTSFFVDRTAPEISISTPASDGQTYYGTIKQNVAAGIITGGDTDTKVYFTVSEDDDLEDFEGIDMSSAVGVSASIVFDGGNGTNNGYHTKTLHNWIKELRASDTSYNIEENDDNVPLYIWYKAVDSCGNFSLEKRLVNVIPNGDKPTVSISYPEYKADSNGNQTVVPALAGTIRIYGTTDIQAYSVDSVYIQIASNYTSTYNWNNWETDLATVTGSSSLTVVDIPFSGTKQVNGTQITYINNKKGIKASGTPDNWNLPINSDGIFETINRSMAIRVFAVSDSGTDADGNQKGKVSDPVVQAFNIDKTAPRIGGDDSENRYSLQLVKFAEGYEGNMSNIVARAAYKSDMWVTGNWYLLTSVYDDNGIKSILLDENKNAGKKELVTTTTVTTVDSKECFVRATDTPTDATTTNYNIIIPLPTGVANTSGSVTYTIEATENTEANLSSVETIKINYDNTPPKVSTKDYRLEGEAMIMSPQVYDEDGFYKLKGYVSDAGGNASGLFGIAFYFVRRGSQNCVYDPMYNRRNSVSITGAKDATASSLENNDIVYANGLYWKHKTLQTRTDSLTEIKLAAADVNIHKGGLVMLGGKIYKIKNLSADGKTITLNDSAPKSITTADFALAMVVDNRGGESQNQSTQRFTDKTALGYGYCSSMTDDDGDNMLERLTGDVEGRWEASIYSKNIPDGPIEIHYVAFDQAQNYTVGIVGNVTKSSYEALTTKDAVDAKNNLSSKSTTADNLTSYYQYYYDADNLARVSNNAPRIASVTVGTDFNGNNQIDDSEKSTEYYGGVLSVAGKSKSKGVADSWILSSNGTSTGNAKFIIKDKTTVGFEIIGGNTNLYYQYSIDDTYKTHAQIQGTDGSAWTRDTKDGGGYKPMTVTRIKDNQDNDIEGKNFNDDGVGYYNASTVAPIEFSLQTIKSKVTSNMTAWWTIELWDETEDTTIFTNSQYAILKLPLNVQVYDAVAPNTVINNLYWNGSNDNSVYTNVNGDLFGHVELIKDIGSSQLGEDYGSDDDKVSGVVVFRGFAYDNKRLSQLDWAIVDSTGKSILPNADSGISYNTGATFSTNGWSSEGDLVYDSTEKKVTGTYKFTVKTAAADGAYLDAKGHKVAWELAVDTSAINGVVAKDAKLYVRAKDDSRSTTTQYTDMAATGSPAEGVTDQEAIDKATKKPTYQVDILPYITGVQTRLSSLNADGSLYGRTALGHYPVGADETSVILQGYNLAAGNGDVTLNATTIRGLPTGEYQYTVSGTIKTINNLNNNDAHGDYDLNVDGLAEKTKVTNMYNRQPNTTNNLTMTDDVYFDMWEFNPTAAMPTDGALVDPVMKINPATNVIGFAFASGTSNFCMPNNNTSYTHWQKSYDNYKSIGLVYDSKGYSYAVAAGADCNDHQADLLNFLSSRWGESDPVNKTGSAYGAKALRLESIGQNFDTNDTPGINAIWGTGPDYDTLYIDKDRIQSPSLAVGTTNDNNANVYFAYYDNINDEIRFRSGNIIGTGNNNKNSNKTLSDDYVGQGTGKNDVKPNEMNNNDYIPNRGGYTTEKCQIIVKDGSDTLGKAGNFVSIAVVNNADTENSDYVVMVWYDQHSKKLYYAYNTDPLAGTTGVNSTNWTGVKEILSSGGEYCQIAVDKDGGIHIAAYDNGKVKYAFMQKFNSSTVTTCTVDSYDIIGQNLTLDVAYELDENGVGHNIPHIGYYALSRTLPKYAYLAKPASTDLNGADSSNYFTGVWETTYIPTKQTVPQDRINVGVFKQNGQRAYSTIGQNMFKANGTKGTSNTSAGSGTCYGNGTNNPVIGYAIKYESNKIYAEVAQLK